MTRLTGIAVVVACLLGVFLVAVAGGGLASLAAPFSGSAWETVDDRGPSTVETPYGRATVTYDDRGVPHVEADSTEALYFAVGYVQARDRLFQMDLFRRQMSGDLSAVFGEATVDSDRFHRRMDFEGAAERKWAAMRNTSLGDPLRAYTAGVNRYVDTGPLAPEFRLNDYRPDRWTPEATILVGMRATWGLSGSFADARTAAVRERLPAATPLYPDRLDHDAAIFSLAGVTDSPSESAAAIGSAETVGSGALTARSDPGAEGSDATGGFDDLYDAVEPYEREAGMGSNNWIVGPNASASGDPMVANDPHLQLIAPPVWYEMNLSSPDVGVHGVAFPGAPMVLIGQTDGVAWGITNVGADVTDLYTYEWRDDKYYHDGTWTDATVETETIAVDGAPDYTVEVRKTVHGPVVEREGRRVAVSWLGLTDTREPLAFYRFNRADDLDEFREGLGVFDMPASNIVAMDESGETLYRAAGTYPIRRTDGQRVPGDRIFNGSAGEGTWRGFVPYGESDLDGPEFVPPMEAPGRENPQVLGTGNQRVVDDPGFYMGTSVDFADPYRGRRIAELLERYRGDDGSLDRAEMKAMQRDTVSLAARQFVPYATGATAEMSPAATAAAERLGEWAHSLRADSRAALIYDRWIGQFRNLTFGDEYYAAGLDRSYYPKHWTLGRLAADSPWFDDRQTRATETRADIAERAMEAAVAEIDREGWETYGDVNRPAIQHPFGRAGAAPFLDYPTKATDGGPFTLFNVRVGGTAAGSSWRMVVDPQRAEGIVPGGNDGVYWSEHYADQLDAWRAGEYRDLWTDPDGGPDVVFEEEDG